LPILVAMTHIRRSGGEMTATVYVSRGRRMRRHVMVVVALSLAGLTSWQVADALAPASSAHDNSAHDSSAHGGSADAWASVSWPAHGSAAVAVGNQRIHTSGPAQAVPIASLAKVMTAVVVLRTRSVSANDPGFTIRITPDDVADTERRRSDGQSVVPVVDGETLTERQALEALLLPSANNIAMALARAVSGTADTFVDAMNAAGRRLGMTSTVYTDPSGYDPSTRSTASDQLLLARTAMRIDAFAEIVAEPEALIPQAGLVHNTDSLLGRDGFIGIKTGSDTAAGGCFVFAATGRDGRHLVYGVVLGQSDGPLIRAALKAAQRLADSVRSALGIT
jgi:D-alanyl-D-alanine carboxypeptidase (penicillin-binding protein 5/6)